VMELVAARLTGEIVANQCTQFTSQLIDNRTLGATEYDPVLVQMSGIDASKLPQLRPLDAPVGTLRAAVAAELGLPAGAVVHAAHATDELGDHATDDPFAALDRVLAAVPPGSGTILFLPWLVGSLSPSANGTMRGGFLNLSLDTERRDLVRAVIEGLGFNLG